MEITIERVKKQKAIIDSYWREIDDIYPRFDVQHELSKEGHAISDECFKKLDKHWWNYFNPFLWRKLRKARKQSTDAIKEMEILIKVIDDLMIQANAEIAILAEMGKDEE